MLTQVAFPRIKTFDSSATPPRPARLAAPGRLPALDLSALRAALAAGDGGAIGER